MIRLTSRLKSVCAAAILASAAAPAAAETHYWHVHRDGYFPTTLHVKPGDVVHFVNETNDNIIIPINIPPYGLLDFTGWIAPGQSESVTFSSGIDRTIGKPRFYNGGNPYYRSGGNSAYGVYGPAPTR